MLIGSFKPQIVYKYVDVTKSMIICRLTRSVNKLLKHFNNSYNYFWSYVVRFDALSTFPGGVISHSKFLMSHCITEDFLLTEYIILFIFLILTRGIFTRENITIRMNLRAWILHTNINILTSILSCWMNNSLTVP